MAEYIDKQKFIDELDDKYSLGDIGRMEHDIIVNALLYVKPADVRPVVHGRWVKVEGFFTPGGDPVWQCSECGKGRHVYGIEHGTYGADVSDGQWLACPNCMADMREAEP